MPAHLLRRAHQRHARLWSQHIGDDPTPPQYAVLTEVTATPGIDLTQLGDRAALDRTTVGRVVDRLVRDGWVSKEADPVNRRRTVVTMTPDGSRRLAEVDPIAAKVSTELLATLDASDTATLLDLLGRLVTTDALSTSTTA